MMADQPAWLTQRKTFWDPHGTGHRVPEWPPRQGTATPPHVAAQTLPRVLPVDLMDGPRQALPKDLRVYYVDDPQSDERWVPMSPTIVQVFTEFAAQQGVSLDWREMPPPVSAARVLRRSDRSGN